MKGGATNPNNVANNNQMILYFMLSIGFIIVFTILAYIVGKMRLDSKNCSNMNVLYKNFPYLSTISVNNETFKHNLRDYYIKSAYNCCAGGNFKNDFVNVCALKNCIKQGARCLDFEIYSVNDNPVVAVSSVDDFNIKETYNSVPFDDAMDVISNYAFSGSTCPNPGDPLIIHLRIMSKNKPIYNQIANILYNTLESKLLGKEYSYEYNGHNLGQLPLINFMGKIILIVDKSNSLFENTELDEYVNLASNAMYMRTTRFNDVVYSPDMNELIFFNKKGMTFCTPDLSESPTNPSPAIGFQYGCQMQGMSYQNFDTNLELYNQKFDDNGSAFILKPEHLRYIPVTIPIPDPPPLAHSYKPRGIKLPSGIPNNFSI